MTVQTETRTGARMQKLTQLQRRVKVSIWWSYGLMSYAVGSVIGGALRYFRTTDTYEGTSADRLAVLVIQCSVGLVLGLIAILAKINAVHADIRVATLESKLNLQPCDSNDVKDMS